jgi:four helix bundle protein
MINGKTIKFDLEERTAIFGEEIIKFSKCISKNEVTRPLIGQIVRSGTSVGANYMEADGAESRKDFIHKLGICKKESKETKHWLRMVAIADPSLSDKSRELWRECQELTLIFSAIITRTKEN